MFTERLNTLRERNKSLLNQLKLQNENLERLSGLNEGRKRDREDEAEPERRPPEKVVTVTGGGCRPARAALARPSVRFADIDEDQPGITQPTFAPSLTVKHRERTAEDSAPSEVFAGSHSPPQDHSRPVSTKSCLITHSKGQTNMQSRVRFPDDECEDAPTTDSHHLRPLLGYDWIAGVLENDDSLMERPDDFFNDLHVFRSLNKDECVHSAQAEFSEENLLASPLLMVKKPDANKDTHECTFSYRINSRLFPVPLHTQECCPVCKKLKSSHPHTAATPALIRVSIPRTTLLPPYKYKAHRRCSFNPSDSVGLPSHCLSGWSNTGQPTLPPPPSSLDLQSSLKLNTGGSLHNEPEFFQDLSAPKARRNRDQMADMSRLARHNFQHFSSRRKPGIKSHPVC